MISFASNSDHMKHNEHSFVFPNKSLDEHTDNMNNNDRYDRGTTTHRPIHQNQHESNRQLQQEPSSQLALHSNSNSVFMHSKQICLFATIFTLLIANHI